MVSEGSTVASDMASLVLPSLLETSLVSAENPTTYDSKTKAATPDPIAEKYIGELA